MSLKTKVNKKIKYLIPLIQDTANTKSIFNKAYQQNNTTQTQANLAQFKEAFTKIDIIIRPTIAELKNNNLTNIDTVLAYLKINTRYFRSGYIKEEICDKLKNVKLNNEQVEILREIFLEQIEIAGREFGYFIKLLPQIQSPTFLEKIKNMDNKENKYVQKRIATILKMKLD